MGELEFAKIRFVTLNEIDSPFYDPDYELFTRFIMDDGRKDLAYELMHKTFYEIKSIQLNRLRKRQENEKKAAAGQKVQSALDPTEEAEVIETNPMVVFKKALKNCEPVVITKKIRRGGAVYQVPFPLTARHSEFLAHKWLIRAVLDRPKPRLKNFPEVMAQELLDASQNRGKVVKMRDDMHRLADANKAYAHYRWG